MKNVQCRVKRAKNIYVSHLIASKSQNPRDLFQTTDAMISPPLTQFPEVSNVKSSSIDKTMEIRLQINPPSCEIYIFPEPVPLFTHF